MDSNLQNEKIVFYKNVWFWFLTTIIILAISYVILNVLVVNKINISKTNLVVDVSEKISKKYPQLFKLFSSFDEDTKLQIKELVEKEIDKAYEPVYNNIDNFVDFHFSVTGEYTELFTILFGKIDNLLKEKVFNPAHFDERIQKAYENINEGVKIIISKNFDKLKEDFKKEGFSEKEIEILFSDILKVTKEELVNRMINYEYNLLRVSGIASGGVIGVLIAKKTSKVIAQKLTSKIATKIAAKTGGKLALKLAGAGSGAVAGAEGGVICGPAAWICAPVFGVVGGIIGWVATDKIVVEIDKYLNEDEFREELVKLIDSQKKDVKMLFINLMTQSFEKSNDLEEKLKDLKQKPIIYLMKDKNGH